MACMTFSHPRRRVMNSNLAATRVSRLMLSTSRPASRRADRYFVRPMPFVVMAIVSRPAVFSVFNRPAVCTGTRTMVHRLVFNSTFSTNRLYHAIGVLNILYIGPGNKTNIQWIKCSERRKHCASAGCSKVRTPSAHRSTHTYKHTHTHRTDYNTLRR